MVLQHVCDCPVSRIAPVGVYRVEVHVAYQLQVMVAESLCHFLL